MSAIPAIHVGLKQLGIQEEDQRDLYERVTGKRSLRQMSDVEKDNVVAELRRLGFSKSSSSSKKLSGRYAGKLQALWIAAWNLGIVNNASDDALIAFVKRQTKIDHVRFVRHSDDAAKAIEALKKWIAREVGNDEMWMQSKLMPNYRTLNGYKIASHQFHILKNGERYWRERGNIMDYVVHTLKRDDYNLFKERDWISIMNDLGKHVRELKK